MPVWIEIMNNDAGSPQFPGIEGKNLAGKRFRLPQDFEGDMNLVMIAFQREQQLVVNTWLPTADLLESIYPELKYYELPTISRMNPFVRWFINTGMRSGIQDPKSRRKTITLYLDKGAFRESLGITREDIISILLVDKTGSILWRSDGACDVEKAKNLSDFLKASLSST
jgi:hypothetical protein